MVAENSMVRRRPVPPLTLPNGNAGLPLRFIFKGPKLNNFGIAPQSP
jgi:hypothetical protein